MIFPKNEKREMEMVAICGLYGLGFALLGMISYISYLGYKRGLKNKALEERYDELLILAKNEERKENEREARARATERELSNTSSELAQKRVELRGVEQNISQLSIELRFLQESKAREDNKRAAYNLNPMGMSFEAWKIHDDEQEREKERIDIQRRRDLSMEMNVLRQSCDDLRKELAQREALSKELEGMKRSLDNVTAERNKLSNEAARFRAAREKHEEAQTLLLHELDSLREKKRFLDAGVLESNRRKLELDSIIASWQAQANEGLERYKARQEEEINEKRRQTELDIDETKRQERMKIDQQMQTIRQERLATIQKDAAATQKVAQNELDALMGKLTSAQGEVERLRQTKIQVQENISGYEVHLREQLEADIVKLRRQEEANARRDIENFRQRCEAEIRHRYQQNFNSW